MKADLMMRSNKSACFFDKYLPKVSEIYSKKLIVTSRKLSCMSVLSEMFKAPSTSSYRWGLMIFLTTIMSVIVSKIFLIKSSSVISTAFSTRGMRLSYCFKTFSEAGLPD